MGKNSRAVTREEYQKIKQTFKWNKNRSIEVVALEFNRSPQTVMYIKGTRNFEEYEYFKEIHNRRNPVSTLGKTVKSQGKRLGKVEAHLYATGAVNAHDLL